jgi:hypothetical protein
MIWVLVVFLVLLLGASVWLNVHTIRKNMQLNDQREELVDTIQESLDTLDGCYSDIARNAEIPVLSDEPVIREVLHAIKRSRNAVLSIAGKVVIYGSEKGDEEEQS